MDRVSISEPQHVRLLILPLANKHPPLGMETRGGILSRGGVMYGSGLYFPVACGYKAPVQPARCSPKGTAQYVHGIRWTFWSKWDECHWSLFPAGSRACQLAFVDAIYTDKPESSKVAPCYFCVTTLRGELLLPGLASQETS